jgi:hypothetical protein
MSGDMEATEGLNVIKRKSVKVGAFRISCLPIGSGRSNLQQHFLYG